MILILSSQDDRAAKDVIDWLIFKNLKYISLSKKSKIEIQLIDLSSSDIIIKVTQENKSFSLNLNDITSYWYRRDEINLDEKQYSFHNPDLFEEKVNTYLEIELINILHFLNYYLQDKKGFGKYSENYTNKLFNLTKAKEAGLKIPATHIITDAKQLKKMSYKQKFITKPIGASVIAYKNFQIGTYTEATNKQEILDSDFKFPSLFQELVEKKYELRIFHLDGQNFASAIFSQRSKKTAVDFRRYDKKNPNRAVPYILQKNIELKINNFMKSINMKSGSLDIIVDKNDNFVFLEVNPVGQYGQVSNPCNYHIEKHIAEYLS